MAIAAQPLTANQLLDQRPLGRFQIWLVVLCGVVLVLDGFDAQIIGFLAPSISDSLKIPVKGFGPIFSASLFGLMIAAMATGPIADRWGRRWPVIASTITFAIFALLTARATSFNQLLAFRFLTGLGLGGAMPNVVALASEYVPWRLQRSFVSMLFAGMPLGGFLVGMISSEVAPRWGWQAVFYLGGILPLLLAVFLIAVLPESVRFLGARGQDPGKIAKILARISPDLANVPIATSPADKEAQEGLPVKHLFTEGRAVGTVLLWIPFFMNLLLLYFVVSWMPALLRQAGLSVKVGVVATALFSLAGIVGCFVEGPLMELCGAYAILLIEFASCALLIASLAFVARSVALVFGVTSLLGFCVTGIQGGINALAASFYPTAIRSTGIGWALGVGRVGSIVGPIIAGSLLSIGWRPQQIFLSAVVPALCAAGAVLLTKLVKTEQNAYGAEPSTRPA